MNPWLLFNTFVCVFCCSRSERSTMGRLTGKVIVLSAAAQGIGRAAAIVMTFNKNFSLIYCIENQRRKCYLIICCIVVKAVHILTLLAYHSKFFLINNRNFEWCWLPIICHIECIGHLKVIWINSCDPKPSMEMNLIYCVRRLFPNDTRFVSQLNVNTSDLLIWRCKYRSGGGNTHCSGHFPAKEIEKHLKFSHTSRMSGQDPFHSRQVMPLSGMVCCITGICVFFIFTLSYLVPFRLKKVLFTFRLSLCG